MLPCFDLSSISIQMGTKAGPFTFAELQTVTSLGRGEIRECVNRGIYQRAGRGRAGEPSLLFKMELGRRCDRCSVAATRSRRLRRERYENVARDAPISSHRSRDLLQNTGNI